MTHEDPPGLRTARGSSGPRARSRRRAAAVRDRDATLKVYLWDASHDRRGGPAPTYRVCPGRVGRARAGGRGSGRAVAEPTGAHVTARPSGARVPGERRAERETRSRGGSGSGCRLTGTTGLPRAGDRLIVKTDPHVNA